MSDHKRPLTLAMAALNELISRAQAMQAAAIRGDGQDAMETMRQEAHDVLDAYLDNTVEAGRAARAILEP